MNVRRVLTVMVFCFGVGMPLQAEPAKSKPGHSLGMPYPDRLYGNDRRGTGHYFREIRKVRQDRGIEAGIAMLGPSLTHYRESLPDTWNGIQAFDEWGFWVWHEAQFDSGKNDPDWASALYRWLHDEARRIRRMDWVFHVSGNVLGGYSTVSRWTAYRQLLGEMSGYLKGQGFDVDPSGLPDRGLWDEEVPGVRLREFPVKIPNGRHVVYWQRHEQKDASKPTWVDNITANHMLHVAREHFTQGEWRKSVEIGLWVCACVDAVSEFNLGGTGRDRVKREEVELYLGAVGSIAGTLRVLGLREAEERLVSRSLEKKLDAQWDGVTWRNHLRARLLGLQIQKGEASEAMLKELDGLIATKDSGHHESEIGAVGFRLLKSKCLMALGRNGEALALLEELRHLTGRKYGNWLDVELTHVDWSLDRGDLTQAGKLLPELLGRVRKDGLKVDEIALYERYVRWAELSGDLGLAVYCQRELLRLLEGFFMTPRLPEARAMLARLLALIGEKDESAAQIAKAQALAEMPNLPRSIIGSVHSTAAELGGTKGGEARKGRVLLLPGSALSMAAAGFPARLMLEVVNVGEGRAEGVVRISGAQCDLGWDRESRRGRVVCREGAGQGEVQVQVDAQSMALFQCVADEVPEDGLAVKAEWIEDGKVLETAGWTVKPADSSSSSAVIDAGIYRTDGFCMIPIYHHLQSRERELANLRVLASVPCRIELYDEAGQLRMVDATGNGSCLESGDWLREDADGNGAVELAPSAATGETNFHLFVDPEGAIPAGGVVLKIEWLIDGKWCLAAEDRIMGK